MKARKSKISIIAILLASGLVIAEFLTIIGRVKTEIEIEQSVTINGYRYDEIISVKFKIRAGNMTKYNILIANHCSKSIKLDVVHSKVKGIEVYIVDNNTGSKIKFPITLLKNTFI